MIQRRRLILNKVREPGLFALLARLIGPQAHWLVLIIYSKQRIISPKEKRNSVDRKTLSAVGKDVCYVNIDLVCCELNRIPDEGRRMSHF